MSGITAQQSFWHIKQMDGHPELIERLDVIKWWVECLAGAAHNQLWVRSHGACGAISVCRLRSRSHTSTDT
ncbi:MAG: hypothetical protein B7X93_12725 [Hydrogenophilales bacterium 17-61-9]|nr:MAG: hypothetical protein B7X93_12725 [Hydrogenophilales bacterium 17-61-9]